ncbi:hypothetical protein [Hymenobacter rubidus]|uniref:hypothetical protein n=1 Tax=Hymenobacter rubidus TaxID=1441626 RepID=UPI00191F4BDB|nr:hypothetical protein [Hymenobacter rubidus]
MSKIGLSVGLLVITACATTKNVGSAERDGSSFEQAIVIRGVAQEYAYVRQVCPDCQFVRQSLTSENKKPYDILAFKKSDGSTVSYYFDISKFFGRRF